MVTLSYNILILNTLQYYFCIMNKNSKQLLMIPNKVHNYSAVILKTYILVYKLLNIYVTHKCVTCIFNSPKNYICIT